MNKSVQTIEPREPSDSPGVVRAVTPLEIFAKAMDKGIPLEQMKELRAMVEWHEAREAEKAFNAAMSEFRSEAITIIKNRRVGYDTKEGGSVGYSHASLDAAVKAAVPALSKSGLSHRWETMQENGLITVICVITHRLGHSQRTTLSAAPDNSGKKNNIQAIGSTVSYLERYTFMAATGLAAEGQDTDGRPPNDDDKPGELITAAELEQVEKLIKDAGADRALLLRWAKVETLSELPKRKLGPVCERLNDMIPEQKS